MGWTSFEYTETTHLKFNAKNAYDFTMKEFNTDNYKIEKFYFQKALSVDAHHEIYLVMKDPKGYSFIMVILIDIVKNDIYYKEITASMGPSVYRCPVEFLSMVKLPNPVADKYEYDWFIKVRKFNQKFKDQLS